MILNGVMSKVANMDCDSRAKPFFRCENNGKSPSALDKYVSGYITSGKRERTKQTKKFESSMQQVSYYQVFMAAGLCS